MATTTTEYNLIKPERTDNVLVEDLNFNMDRIDVELKKRETSLDGVYGKVLKNISVYNSLGSVYNVGDFTKYTTSGITEIYECISTTTGAFDTSKWNKITLSNASETIKGVSKYGTTDGTALEGNQLAKVMGVESSKIGGLISTTGTKTAGNVYYDTLTESYYICNVTNNQNFIDLVNFTPISNTDLSINIQKMIAYRAENPTLVGDRGSSTNGIQLIKKGNLKIINFLNVPIANNQANESYIIPDWFFENVPTGVYACTGSDYIQTTPAEIFLRTATKKFEFNNANFVAGRTYSGQLIVVEN